MSRDTSVTPYTRPPVSTDVTRRDRPRDGNLMAICRQSTAIWRQSAAFCHILPSPPNPAKFCQDRYPNPILLRARVDQATKLTIYTLSSRLLTFFPYATSWPHHTVHVYSLIISTLLHIIVACTHSVTSTKGVFGCNKELFKYEVAPCFDRR
jgi:hypothetical protein